MARLRASGEPKRRGHPAHFTVLKLTLFITLHHVAFSNARANYSKNSSSSTKEGKINSTLKRSQSLNLKMSIQSKSHIFIPIQTAIPIQRLSLPKNPVRLFQRFL